MGDMARRRRDIIARLQSEGVAEMNKELELPLVPQKIAIISSSTAAGYEDFVAQLTHNKPGYHFDLKLFPAIMQGNQAESSIIAALEQIYLYENFFDAVVIIRGGGSQADLSCFDNYNLAYYITQFPLPVITGIGHEKDDSIVDLVAHTRLKTPTAVAEFLISGVARFDLHLDELKNRFFGNITEIINKSKNDIEQIARLIAPITREKISKGKNQLTQTVWKLDNTIKIFIQNQNYKLGRKEETVRHNFTNFNQSQLRLLEKTTRILTGSLSRLTISNHDQLKYKMQRSGTLVRNYLVDRRHHLELSLQKGMLTDPYKILARGYSVTTYNGHTLKDTGLLNSSALIETRLFRGHIFSEVKTLKKDN